MKPILKPIAGALASAAVVAFPLAAAAQGHHGGGGFHGGGGWHGGSGFHGGASFHGGDWRRGGWHGGGWDRHGYYRHGYGYGGYALGGFGLGLALGAATAPWGYYGPDYYYDYPDYAYAAPPPPACGSWSWNPARGAYDWLPC